MDLDWELENYLRKESAENKILKFLKLKLSGSYLQVIFFKSGNWETALVLLHGSKCHIVERIFYFNTYGTLATAKAIINWMVLNL